MLEGADDQRRKSLGAPGHADPKRKYAPAISRAGRYDDWLRGQDLNL